MLVYSRCDYASRLRIRSIDYLRLYGITCVNPRTRRVEKTNAIILPNYKDIRMKITELSLLGLFLVSLLTGCGSNSDSDSGAISSLKGSWQHECTEDDDGSSQNGNVIYNEDSLHFFANYYSDNDCQNLSIRIEMSGLYALGDATILDSGAVVTYLSQDITSFQVAYYDSSAISVLNDSNVCDISTWVMGELQEIRNCSEFYLDFDDFEKDIVSIENNQMVSGDFDFIGENGYPTQLETEGFTLQETTALEGEWLQGCRVEGQSGYRRKLEFIGNSISLELDGYTDTSCENIVYSQQVTYLFELGNDQILASGESVTEMVNSMFSAHMAFYGEDIISEVNSNSLLACGLTSWKDAVYKDVFECDWVLKPVSNEFKEIVKINDNELTFGDDEYIGEDGFATQLQAESYIRQ